MCVARPSIPRASAVRCSSLPYISTKDRRESVIYGNLPFKSRGFLQNRCHIAEYVRFFLVHFVHLFFVFIHIPASNDKKRILFADCPSNVTFCLFKERQIRPDGRGWEASLFGMRTALLPKLRTPASGILTVLGFVKHIMRLQCLVGQAMQGGLRISRGAGRAS